MDAQPETTTPIEKNSVNWRAFILWLFVILLLYVLSIGPVMMLEQNAWIAENQFEKPIYRPVQWIYLKTPLHKPLGIYLHLWAPKWFDKKGNNYLGDLDL
jgi:hypothetical protein